MGEIPCFLLLCTIGWLWEKAGIELFMVNSLGNQNWIGGIVMESIGAGQGMDRING